SAYPRTHYEKALYFQQTGQVDRALVEFLKATQEDPRLVKAFYQQALIFQGKGYLKLAESSLEQALSVKPDFQQARVLLAAIHLQQGNLGGAVMELSRSLGLPEGAARAPSQRAPVSVPGDATPTANQPESKPAPAEATLPEAPTAP